MKSSKHLVTPGFQFAFAAILVSLASLALALAFFQALFLASAPLWGLVEVLAILSYGAFAFLYKAEESYRPSNKMFPVLGRALPFVLLILFSELDKQNQYYWLLALLGVLWACCVAQAWLHYRASTRL